MKKVLFMTNMFPSKKDSTYGVFVQKTYLWLKEVYDVDLLKITKQNSKIIKTMWYIEFYLKAIFKGIIKNYDCIYAHYISHCALPIKLICFFKKNIIIIGNVHGEDVFSKYREYQKNKIWSRRFISKSNYIIAPSEYFKQKVSLEYEFDISNIFVSPSGGVDTNIFSYKNKVLSRKILNLDNDKFYIGFVSRIETGKGWDTFLNAANKIIQESKEQDIYFVIVGDGNEKRTMQEYISKLKIENRIVEFSLLPHDILPYLYSSLDIFCFPSRREAESLGLVGLEAMACNIPCVLSNVEGIMTYAIHNVNCKVFEASSYIDLADKIQQIISMNKEELNEMLKRADETAQKYDKNAVHKAFMDFFSYIL